MSERGSWSGNYGFIIAAIGSAVGLGNLWRFPYLVGQGGGGVFLLLYLFLVILLGVSLILAEQAIGRKTGLNTLGAFRAIDRHFSFVGVLAIVCTVLVTAFYGMIGGWVLYYLLTAIVAPATQSAEGFASFSTGILRPVVFQLLFMLITAFFVWRGVSKGIERANRVMMPMLFVILVAIVIRSVTLPGAVEGIKFFLLPDFSKLTIQVVISAMGQVFFSMSIGFGIMITYASYLSKDVAISRASWIVALSNTGVAILAGFAILPAVFAFGHQPEQGPGLLFVALPGVFEQMPGGYFFSILFFLLVAFAALSSSISLLEVPVSYIVDEWKRSRSWAVIISSVVISAIGILCVCSMGPSLGWFKVGGYNFFELLDVVTNNFMLPVGGILLCVVVGYVWGTKPAIAEISQNGKHAFLAPGVWAFIIRYIAPAAILIVLLGGLGVF